MIIRFVGVFLTSLVLQIKVVVGQSNNQMVMSRNRLQVVFGSGLVDS